MDAASQEFSVENNTSLSDNGNDGAGNAPDVGGQSPTGEPTDVKASTTEALKSILDLDKVETRFRLNGREWDKKEFQESLLRQADYSKKTQALSEKQNLVNNLPADMAHVLAGRATVEQLAQAYAKSPELVQVAKLLLGGLNQQKPTQPAESNGEDKTPWKQDLAPILDYINSDKETKKQEAVDRSSQELDTIFSDMEKKYPEANSEIVNARLLAALQAGHDVTDEKGSFKKDFVEKLFKKSEADFNERYTKKYSGVVKKQQEANGRGMDSGGQGAPPGQAPKTAKTLREAKAQLEADIEAGRL